MVFKNLTVNHGHNFFLNVSTSSGKRNSSSYYWYIGKFFGISRKLFLNIPYFNGDIYICIRLIDTIPPTATITSETTYTNSADISIGIKFSEACTGRGGFKCSNASNCDVSQNFILILQHIILRYCRIFIWCLNTHLVMLFCWNTILYQMIKYHPERKNNIKWLKVSWKLSTKQIFWQKSFKSWWWSLFFFD